MPDRCRCLDRVRIDTLVESRFLDGGSQQDATVGARNDVDVGRAHDVLNQRSVVRGSGLAARGKPSGLSPGASESAAAGVEPPMLRQQFTTTPAAYSE